KSVAYVLPSDEASNVSAAVLKSTTTGTRPGRPGSGKSSAAARSGNALGTGFDSSAPSAGASHEFTGAPPGSRTAQSPLRAATVTPGRLTLTSIVRNLPSNFSLVGE